MKEMAPENRRMIELMTRPADLKSTGKVSIAPPTIELTSVNMVCSEVLVFYME
jgi:hypothetical protein